MKFRFNAKKDSKLLQERGVGFQSIIDALSDEKNLLAIEAHPNQEKYPNQKIFYVQKDDEVFSVPFVIEQSGAIFLKTVFANRKARKKFLKKPTNKKPRT